MNKRIKADNKGAISVALEYTRQEKNQAGGKIGVRDVPAADDHGGEERDLETSFNLSVHNE